MGCEFCLPPDFQNKRFSPGSSRPPFSRWEGRGRIRKAKGLRGETPVCRKTATSPRLKISIPAALDQAQSLLLSPGNGRQCLETFLVVTAGGWGVGGNDIEWVESRILLNTPQCAGQPSPAPTTQNEPAPNVTLLSLRNPTLCLCLRTRSAAHAPSNFAGGISQATSP